jgi:hypothetical protein
MRRGGTGNPTNQARPEPRCQFCKLTVALVLLLGGVGSANAQMGGGPMGGGHGNRQKNQQKALQQTPAPPPPAAIPEPWPRLDIGAVLCKSRDDLTSYQTQAMAGPDVAAPEHAPDCRIVQKRIAIKIMDRDGPSRTRVTSTDATKQTGWTNAYLPSNPSPSIGTATSTVR